MKKRFSSLYPKEFKERVIGLLGFCGYKEEPEEIIGKVMLVSIISSLILSPIISLLTNFFLFPIFLIGIIVLVNFSFFIFLSIYSNKRARNIESVLPNFLDLFAMNMSAGMPISDAFIMSARPEYGYFAEEIELTGKNISLGKTFEGALSEMGARIKSSELRKAINLIISTQRSGGKIKETLISIADDFRERLSIINRTNQELKGNVMIFSIIIMFLVPILYAMQNIMTRIVTSLTTGMGQITGIETESMLLQGMDMAVVEININPSFLLWFGIIAIIIKCIMGSMMIGYITKGDVKEGFKLTPVFIIVSMIVFFLIKIAMNQLFISAI